MQPEFLQGKYTIAVKVRLCKHFFYLHYLVFDVYFPLVQADFAKLGERNDEKVCIFNTNVHISVKKLQYRRFKNNLFDQFL